MVVGADRFCLAQVDEDVIPQTGKLVTEQNPPAHIEGFTARDWKRQVGKKTAVESLTLGELLGGESYFKDLAVAC